MKKTNNLRGEKKMYMHKNIVVAFKQVSEMFKNKKTCKNGKVFFSQKDAGTFLSPIAIEILLQLDKETVRSGRCKRKERA